MFNSALNDMESSFKNTDLIVVIDREGQIMYYNNFDDKINKYKDEDTIGKYIWEVYPWVRGKDTTIFKVMEIEEPITNQFYNVFSFDDRSLTAINSAFPLKNKDGVVGAIGISVASYVNSEPTKNEKKNSMLNASYSFKDIKTNNPEMIDMLEKLKISSKSNSNIFIYGETGTGKELIAHSIHNESDRRDKPFIAQNCAAIPETLMESIFFGTTKGSFTGAEDKKGLFEVSDGGTVFLDEINSMPLDMQVKILRVIEEKKVRKIGSSIDVPIDIRIIAATNEEPEKLVQDNRLRMDLYFRLNVIGIKIPPLRHRQEDIELLSNYFIQRFNNIFNKNVIGLDPEVKKLFLEYSWPGNVRELRNAMEAAFNIVDGDYISMNELPQYLTNRKNNIKKRSNKAYDLHSMVDQYEKEIIEKTLVSCKYNITKTAKTLNIPRQTLYYKLNKYNLIDT